MAVMFLSSPLTGEKFINRRRDRNWAQLGRGLYGTALGKGRLVWKVQPFTSTGWGAYISLVALGTLSGPHVPKVRALVRLACGGIAALMERLRPAVQAFGKDASWAISSGLYSSARPGIDCGEVHAEMVARRWPGVPALARKIGRTFTSLDMHAGNFMARPDGTLVITDPVT